MRIAQIAPLHEAVPPKLYGGTERVVSSNEAVERLARDAQLRAQVADLGVTLGHCCLRQAELGRRHRVGTAAVATTGTRRREPRDRSLADQLALELCERGENPEHQPAAGGRGVDIGALPGQDAKANPAFHQIMDGVDVSSEGGLLGEAVIGSNVKVAAAIGQHGSARFVSRGTEGSQTRRWRKRDSNPRSPGKGEPSCHATDNTRLRRNWRGQVWSISGFGAEAAAVQLDLFIAASHSMEPGAQTGWVGCGLRRCSAACASWR
jgi:hypothetical protein